MIASFANKVAEDIFHGANTKNARKLPMQLWSAARRKLDMVNAAAAPKDLKVPPGNHLEKLSGERDGQWSIRINDQYRICFRFNGGEASDVEIVDYH